MPGGEVGGDGGGGLGGRGLENLAGIGGGRVSRRGGGASLGSSPKRAGGGLDGSHAAASWRATPVERKARATFRMMRTGIPSGEAARW